MPLVSVVVPVYGNAAQLLALYERMSAAVAAESGVIAKLVFVDDGSPDASYEVLARTTSQSSAFDCQCQPETPHLGKLKIPHPLTEGGGKWTGNLKEKWSLSPPCRAATAVRRLVCPRPGWAGRSRWLARNVGKNCTA
jgi:hypothetical protein